MDYQRFFPVATFGADEVHARVASRWDLSGPLPLPSWDMPCPKCGALSSDEAIQIRRWEFVDLGNDKPHTVRWRCNVRYKCTTCSHEFHDAPAIPDSLFYSRGNRLVVQWRDGLEELRQHAESSQAVAGFSDAAQAREAENNQ